MRTRQPRTTITQRLKRRQPPQPQPRAAFPPNPNVGDQVTGPDGNLWEWNGTSWIRVEGGGPGGPLIDPTTTKGDLIVRGTAAITRLAVGAEGQVLTADSAASLGVVWKTGTSGVSYVHTESAASDEWVIPHQLNFRYVSVQIVDDSGDTVIADIDYVNTTRVDLSFANPVSGTAIIRR